MRLCRGSTRWVVLVGKWAIKFPSLYSWENFLHGLLANCQEAKFGRPPVFTGLCPIKCHVYGGWLLIMPKVRVLNYWEWEAFDYQQFLRVHRTGDLVEPKRDSFGYLDGEIVAIDYGS